MESTKGEPREMIEGPVGTPNEVKNRQQQRRNADGFHYADYIAKQEHLAPFQH